VKFRYAMVIQRYGRPNELPKAYRGGFVRTRDYDEWEKSGFFNPNLAGKTKVRYVVSFPPPNRTGTLHVGHATVAAISDIMIRLNASRETTLWLPGTDHGHCHDKLKWSSCLLKKE